MFVFSIISMCNRDNAIIPKKRFGERRHVNRKGSLVLLLEIMCFDHTNISCRHSNYANFHESTLFCFVLVSLPYLGLQVLAGREGSRKSTSALYGRVR